MDIELAVSPDHPALPGHFPGNPIVPAVVMVQTVARRLSSETGAKINQVSQLRLQQPLLPAQPVTMSCEPRGPDAWRVALKAEGALVARGIFGKHADPLSDSYAGPAGNRTRRKAPDAYRLLPHSGTMALIEEFETDEAGRAYTSVSQFNGHPLAEDGGLSPWAALEYAAQLYGCRSVLDPEMSPSPGESLERAYIVMVRSLQIDGGRLLANGDRAELVLQVVTEQSRAAQCGFEARVDGRAWSRGEFTVVSGS